MKHPDDATTNCSPFDSTDHPCMPPPSHIFHPGTDDYRLALEAGLLQVSLPVNHHHSESNSASFFSPPPIVSVPNDVTASESNELVIAPSFCRVVSPTDPMGDTTVATAAVATASSGSSIMTVDDDTSPYASQSSFPLLDNASSLTQPRSTPMAHHDATVTPMEEANEDDPQPPSMRSNNTTLLPRTRFADIIGHGHVKLHMEQVLLPYALPPDVAAKVFVGARAMPASVLLYGPPGCGKTQMARAMAGEARAAFLPVAPSDILSKFVGESEAAVRATFNKAAKLALQMSTKCCVLFLDEVDALGQSRDALGSGEGEGCSRRVLAELLMVLSELEDKNKHKTTSRSSLSDNSHFRNDHEDDGMSLASLSDTDQHARVIVVAATNRPNDLDPALIRRFGIQLAMGLPNQRARKKILQRQLQGLDHTISNENLDYLATLLQGWSGSDLVSLVRQAVMTPVRECLHQAALLRKRKPRSLQQAGGDASTEVESAGPSDPDVQAREFLLQAVTTLRPVSVQDFFQAMENFGADNNNHNNNGNGATMGPEDHYDSSDDES